MSRKWFWVVPLTALLVIALLVLGGWAIHRAGWTQGYSMGQLAAGDEGGVTVGYAPHVPYGFGHPPLFMTISLLVLLFVMIGRVFHLLAWRMAGGPRMMAYGPRGRYWARHWHPRHGHMPPWCWGWQEPSDEQAEEAKPGKPGKETGEEQ